MALPSDVTIFELTFGPYTDASGAVVTTKNSKGDPLTAKLHAIDLATGRRLNVTDVATGQVVVPKDLTVTIGSDGTGSIGPLPHTDNPGLSTVGFGYWLEWDIASGSHSYTPGNKRFAVPTAAGATVDFDLLDVAAAVPGVLVPMGVSAGVADAAVSALLPGPSLTQAAFDGRYATDAELAAGLATKAALLPRNTLVLDGDSLTALGQNDTPDPNTGNDSFGYMARGPWNWALMHLSQRLNLIANVAISGQKTTDVRARFAANVAPLRPGFYACTIGTNNITEDVPLADTQADVLWLIEQCRQMGTVFITTTIPPHSNDSTASPPRRTARVAYNNWLKSLRSLGPDVIVIDTMPRILNPVTSEYATGYSFDGVHYGAAGAQAAGRHIAEVLDPILPKGSPLPSSPLDPENLLPNPFMIGSTGGVSNSTVVGDNGGSTHTQSKVARTDGIPGEWQRVTSTATGTGSGVRCYQVLNPVTSVIGKRLRAWVEFQCPVDDWASVAHFRLNLTAYTTDFSQQIAWFSGSVNAADTWLSGYRPAAGVLATPYKGLLIPAWAQRVDVRVEFKGLGTFDVGRMKLAVVP